MNVTEIARKLNVSTQDLLEKLPELGFDVGQKAIKVNDEMGLKIIKAWKEFQVRELQKAQYLKTQQTDEKEVVVLDKKASIPRVLTVKDFATVLNMPVSKVITELMKNGVLASMNQKIDFDTAAIVAAELGYAVEEIDLSAQAEMDTDTRIREKMNQGLPAEFMVRPPVIVVMGHVDHGKTKLLDAIRDTDVVSGEAGGITQHIGAYQVTRKGQLITFIDTPGHEAFTAMRSRGAKVADVAILVVAATEGVKPQTIESVKIAQDAGIPIIVALNKIDLPDSNIDRVKQELAKYGLMAEEWGGKTIFVPISAKFKTNIDELLDNVLLLTEMEKDKIVANPKGDFVGSVIDARVDVGEGPVATVLVKNGTLHRGDYIIINGVLYGRIRSMRDYKNRELDEALPSMPARIQGLKAAPKVGDILEVTDDQKKAQRVKSYVMNKQEETYIKQPQADTSAEGKEPEAKLNVILRTDVLGSQEAIIESLKKIETEDIKINIVSKGLGNVTESDVLSAEATGAIVLGFSVMVSTNAKNLASDKKVDIKMFKIIYELLDEVKDRLRQIVKPKIVREDLGKLEVLMIFKAGKDFQVVGGKVKDGVVENGVRVAVLRNNEFITSGKIAQLRVGKQDVKDVMKGQECGLKFAGQPLIEVGDILDIYREQEIKKII